MLRPPPPDSSSQQVPNSSLGNSVNGIQNPIQIQPQMNNLHGNAGPNMAPPMFQPGMMMNLQNPIMAMHNNPYMGFPNPAGNFQGQGQGQGQLNLGPGLNQMNMNSCLPLAQFFGQNMPHLVQQWNQNMGLSNGQFCLPFQNMNQHGIPGQMLNMPQVPPPHNSFGGPNQSVPMAFQPFGVNQTMVPFNQNPQNFMPHAMGGPGSNQLPSSGQPLQGNSTVPFNSLTQPQQGSSTMPFNSFTQPQQGNSNVPFNSLTQPQQGNSNMPFNSLTQPQQGNSTVPFNSFTQLQQGNLNVPFNSLTQPQQGNSNMPFNSLTQPQQGNSTVPFNSLTQPQQGNSTVPFNSLTQPQGPQQARNLHSSTQPQQARNLQSPAFVGSQGNSSKNDGGNGPNSFSSNLAHRNFSRNSNQGFQKNQTQHMKNEKNKFGFAGGQKGKGFHNERRNNKFGRTGSTDQVKDQKRSLSLVYSEQEICQWREARRKNYPSSTNIQKKLTEKQTDCALVDKEAQLLRQELKEVLAKQAELGVEVAEIPPEYLSYSEKRDNRNRRADLSVGEEAEGASAGKENSRNRFNKRGRHEKKNRSRKKGKSEKHLSNTKPSNKREPTLLQKLLKADVKRDKSQLLQALRFMVMNSFFKEWPNEPLKFPLVMVKENGSETNVVDEKSLSTGTGSFNLQETKNIMVEKIDSHDVDNSYENDDDDDDNNNEKLKRDGIQVHEEEEGEIID